MANIKAALKYIRASRKRREQNSQERARLRTYDKKIRGLLLEKKVDEARGEFKTYTTYLDRAGKKHLIHQKQADRRKSRIAALINTAAAAN